MAPVQPSSVLQVPHLINGTKKEKCEIYAKVHMYNLKKYFKQ